MHVSQTAAELGALGVQVDGLVALWESKGVPEKDRVLDIVISDADSGPAVFAFNPGVLSALDQPAAWFNRTFLRTSLSAQEDTPFAKAFADDPAAVTWTHEGFATVSEDEMIEEIMKAVMKAHETGAGVNVVAQGVSAGPVLKALRRLEGTKVGANKVVLVGWNRQRLKLIPSIADYDFSQPGNVTELVSIWRSKETFDQTTEVQLLGGDRDGAEYDADKLWPRFSQDSPAADLAWLVKTLVRPESAMARIIAQQEQALRQAEAKKAAEAAARAAQDARSAADEAGRSEALAKMAAQEAAVKRAAAAKAAEQAAQKDAAARAVEPPALREVATPQTAASAASGDTEKLCARCCADVQGSWDYSGHCCIGAEYDRFVASCNPSSHNLFYDCSPSRDGRFLCPAR